MVIRPLSRRLAGIVATASIFTATVLACILAWEYFAANPHGEPDLGFKARGHYYGGKWHEATSGTTFDSVSPSTGRTLAQVPYADEKDVDPAVRAAAKGFEEWRKVGIKERAKCLEAFAKRIRDNAKELALIDAVDAGGDYVYRLTVDLTGYDPASVVISASQSATGQGLRSGHFAQALILGRGSTST